MSIPLTMTATTQDSMIGSRPARRDGGTIATRVWLDEYGYLQSLFNTADNCSPKFRLPDLISACVSLVFLQPEPARRIFTYLHTELVLRDPESPRRQEQMWKPQYDLLLQLQRSPANGHPHPQFKLDHFTTACIALVRESEGAQHRIFEQARRNTAERAARKDTAAH